ncbi:MAG: hypothetical protein ABSD58_08205 [Verrucomicrobiia bacterium]
MKDRKRVTISDAMRTERHHYCSSLAYLPLVLAITASIIQGTCVLWNTHAGIGVAIGIDTSVGAIFSGHILISRIKRLALSGHGLALFGLIAAYLSLLTIPVMVFISFLDMHDSF